MFLQAKLSDLRLFLNTWPINRFLNTPPFCGHLSHLRCPQACEMTLSVSVPYIYSNSQSSAQERLEGKAKGGCLIYICHSGTHSFRIDQYYQYSWGNYIIGEKPNEYNQFSLYFRSKRSCKLLSVGCVLEFRIAKSVFGP